MQNLFLSSFLVILYSTLVESNQNPSPKPLNLLFIIFDDLRTELSIYGRDHMITPNFERLASKSVIFDQAYSQIAVCNPSRDSLLTGLRPDTIGTYGFQSSFRPHLIFPSQLVRSGYNTAGFGKIAHWETNDPEVWSREQWDNGWYKYQQSERNWMNASTMPDKIKPEEKFRDYEFTTRTINSLEKLSQSPEPFMVAIGYKLPHLAVHLPYKYYDMYKGKENSWKLSKKELRFPHSSPSVSYRCCAEPFFHYMSKEGAEKAIKSIQIENIDQPFTSQMHDELMMGYCGAITFVDTQLGRLLDTMDRLSLWENTMVILTADHGMHNGEKGIWEKWSMFDESTRVPLLISHPHSPFPGQHYSYPVELLDIYPTINDLLYSPYDIQTNCPDETQLKIIQSQRQKDNTLKGSQLGLKPLQQTVCPPLQGKSLAPVILGLGVEGDWETTKKKITSTNKRPSIDRKDLGAQSYSQLLSSSSSSLISNKNKKKSKNNNNNQPPYSSKSNTKSDSTSSPSNSIASSLLNPLGLFKKKKITPSTTPSATAIAIASTSSSSTRQLLSSSTSTSILSPFSSSLTFQSIRPPDFMLGEKSIYSPNNNNNLMKKQKNDNNNNSNNNVIIPFIPLNQNNNNINNLSTSSSSSISSSISLTMPILNHRFAITQSWRCAKKDKIKQEEEWFQEFLTLSKALSQSISTTPNQLNSTTTTTTTHKNNNKFKKKRHHKGKAETQEVDRNEEEEVEEESVSIMNGPKRELIWSTCDRNNANPTDELSLMGYSMRTKDFRYTAWFHFQREKMIPLLDVPPFKEELYDHRGETFAQYTHQELVNLSGRTGFESIKRRLNSDLIQYIQKYFVFRGPFKG